MNVTFRSYPNGKLQGFIKEYWGKKVIPNIVPDDNSVWNCRVIYDTQPKDETKGEVFVELLDRIVPEIRMNACWVNGRLHIIVREGGEKVFDKYVAGIDELPKKYREQANKFFQEMLNIDKLPDQYDLTEAGVVHYKNLQLSMGRYTVEHMSFEDALARDIVHVCMYNRGVCLKRRNAETCLIPWSHIYAIEGKYGPLDEFVGTVSAYGRTHIRVLGVEPNIKVTDVIDLDWISEEMVKVMDDSAKKLYNKQLAKVFVEQLREKSHHDEYTKLLSVLEDELRVMNADNRIILTKDDNLLKYLSATGETEWHEKEYYESLPNATQHLIGVLKEIQDMVQNPENYFGPLIKQMGFSC